MKIKIIKSYRESRGDAYYSIGDQLDLLYQDKINGTNTWEEHILAVKNAYPKPKPTPATKNRPKGR